MKQLLIFNSFAGCELREDVVRHDGERGRHGDAALQRGGPPDTQHHLAAGGRPADHPQEQPRGQEQGPR